MMTNHLSDELIKKKFGITVRKLRTQKGFSQEVLAERTGLHRTYISDVEQGERNLSLININKFCKALEISLANFFKMMEEEKFI
ncbi:helix-turn-helix transcriptional regulator [Sutcliffiella horikoshii]|uniref:Helix-turn-helix transcriptional regulator n=1 Tax=Sutcliffiella horikoshii TaxID=79883 RepID=A0A5D4T3W1_9BACI|nr:helix-turn-helix transcriptional regulator [Sutcliffiella horikoshii]TYS68824.1 helix-turn-helix transcriptional regulator [Sutcliffiella horikoshii]